MKCLVIKPEYVIEILEGRKDIEYRSWPTKHRGDIFIACSATKYSKGFIAGVVNITDCTYDDIDCVYEWHLADIRGVRPIPIVGKLRLFETGIDTYEVLHTDEDIERAYKETAKDLQKGGK